MARTISEATRRAIIDYLMASDISWSGRLSDEDFLSRLYDLTKLPSADYRFKSAAGDIWQHRTNFKDWEDDWVFYDSRFNVLRAPDEEFLRFLCETIHPVVRPDPDEARRIATEYNSALQADGWRLIEGKQISGRPLFVAEKMSGRVQIFEAPTGWQRVDRQLQEVRLRLETAESEEQYQAIGLVCREVLISVAEVSFDPTRHMPIDEVSPSDTDARRRLEALFETELSGSANEEARVHAKGALRLAVALQHKRTADFKVAALCAEATASVVNLVAIAIGRRSP